MSYWGDYILLCRTIPALPILIMGALFDIMYYAIGSFFLGVILTLLGMVLMFFLVKSWLRNAEFTPASYIVGGILFFFLAFQTVLLCGAVTIKSYVGDVELYVNSLVSGLSQSAVLSSQDSQEILDRINDDFPLVGYYVDIADFGGHTPQTIASSMADELCSYMNWYILRRLLWMLLFVAVGAFGVIKTMGKSTRSTSRHGGTTNRYVYDD